MRVCIATSSILATELIEHVASREELVSILSTPSKPKGRGRHIVPSELESWALAHHMAFLAPPSLSEAKEYLLQEKIDLVITQSYGRIITQELLNIPTYGWINIHFSLLPRWRGAAPVQHTILNHESETGISIFRLESGVDTGPIYSQAKKSLHGTESTSTLLKELSKMAVRSIDDVLIAIEKGVPPSPQDHSRATLAPKFSKEDGRLDWNLDYVALDARIRALGENPGCWTSFRGQTLRIHQIKRTSEKRGDRTIGTLVSDGNSLSVVCTDGVIEILSVTPSGRKRMSGTDFARGARLEPGECCE